MSCAGFSPRLTRAHTVLTGRKSAHTSSKTLEIHKVFPTAFSSSGRLSASAKLLAPDSDGFSCDFWLLRRRCVVTHQDEKARPTSRTPSKAQRSGFARKKEEGESIMEFSPQGGNGMARTSSDAVRRMCSCQPRVSLAFYIPPVNSCRNLFLTMPVPGIIMRV